MIQFAYASGPNETIDPAVLSASGFSTLETAGVGRSIGGDLCYTLIAVQPPGTRPAEAAAALIARVTAEPAGEVLLENGGAFVTPRELWLVLETALHPRVKIAWSASAARAAGRTAAMAVPTLNLRIGLVRIDRLDDEALNYARRLAGIGFAGWIVIDPPEQAYRYQQAEQMIAGVKAAIAPRKATKAVAKAKA